jgi:thiamine biosynthesis lipoprotein
MHRLEEIMGIPISVDVRHADPELAAAALDEAFTVLRAADARFSPFRADSELARLDRGELADDELSDDMREVLAIAARAHADSGGVFDVRTPEGRLDTNGVVKGWAAQRAADGLLAAGLVDFCLNAGGDVVARGEPEPGRPWQVAVRDPADPGSVLAMLAVRDGAVATSGTYERGAHVWDGRTGSRDLPLIAATVVAADLTVADVLATTVLAMGVDGPAWAMAHGAVAVLAVPVEPSGDES